MTIGIEVSIPDSRLAHEITELVRDTESPLLFHHSRRVFYWGALTGARRDRASAWLTAGWLMPGRRPALVRFCSRITASKTTSRLRSNALQFIRDAPLSTQHGVTALPA